MLIVLSLLGLFLVGILGLCVLINEVFIYHCKKCGKRYTYIFQEEFPDFSGKSEVYTWRFLRCFNPKCRHQQILENISVE